MSSISLRHVSVEFPVYQTGARSIKKALIAGATMGNLARGAHDRVIARALHDVSLHIRDGERVAILGANGAGKTTLLKVLTGIYKPTGGRINIRGCVMTLLDQGVGLNPDATGRENIILRGMYMGIRPRDMRVQIEDITEFTELGGYLDLPVRTYSSGMMIRLALAISTCIQPEILIVDEWLSAGDEQFLIKARQRMEQFVQGSRILVLASHSLDLARQWCSRAILLRQGVVAAEGPIENVISSYLGRDRSVRPLSASSVCDAVPAK